MAGESMTIQHCCNCDIRFDLTTRFYRQRLEDGGTLYCPNGHGQVFVSTSEEQLKKVLAQNEALARENRSLKQQVSRRAANGRYTEKEKP